jgi:hypothetical protein
MPSVVKAVRHAMTEPQDPDKQQSGSHDARMGENSSRQPFDTSDLDRLPGARHDDPPYRDWWVVDGEADLALSP